MADRAKKISELTSATGAANTDVMILVVNTAGTAVTKKIAFSNVVASVATVVSANLNVVASGRVAFGSNNNVITGSNNFTFDGSTVTITTNTVIGIAGSQGGLIRLLGAVASNVGPDIPNLYSLGNTTHAWAGLFVGTVNAASLNVSGVMASGNTTVTGFVNVSSYGTFGGTVNAASLNVSGLTSISNVGLITAPQVGNIIPFYYANQAAFPSASSYHGALAHSHSDGKMYFAHGGSWNAIVSDGTTANVSGLNIGANVVVTTSGISVGNSTVNVSITSASIDGNVVFSGDLTVNNYVIASNGTTSAYATKYLVEYNPTTKDLTYSSKPDASRPYITGYGPEIHVSPVALDDTGNGTIGDPVKTIAQAQVLAAAAFETTAAGSRKTIILHPGDYAENVTINTQYTVLTTHELVGKNTTLSGTLTIAKGCTIDGLKMTNLAITANSSVGSVDIIGCTVTTATTKTSNAYTVFRGCDLSSSSLNIAGAGSIVMVGGNYGTVTVNNAAAGVLSKTVITMGPVTLAAGTMQISDTIVYAASNTSNAITQSAGSVLTLNNSQTLIPDLSNVARNSFGGYYSILHSVYDKTNSTFGGVSLNAISYSQYIDVDRLNVGNTTVNVAISSTSISVGNTTVNTSANSTTLSVNGVSIFTGAATTRAAVNTQVGTAGSNGSIYLSTAGKIYLKISATGTAATDWQRVTTTAVD